MTDENELSVKLSPEFIETIRLAAESVERIKNYTGSTNPEDGFVKSAYQAVVIKGGEVLRKDFWELPPQEFWWIFEQLERDEAAASDPINEAAKPGPKRGQCPDKEAWRTIAMRELDNGTVTPGHGAVTRIATIIANELRLPGYVIGSNGSLEKEVRVILSEWKTKQPVP